MAKFWKIHVILNSSKRNQRFCFDVFNKKLLIDTEPSFNFWLTMKQNQKHFDELPKNIHIHLTTSLFLKKVCQLCHLLD